MYTIHLPNFEGPFDLLLYFIKRDELNIYDIPIAKITEEFLNYVRIMQHFDLELAGEFLVMVTTLMYIKLQMLLPKTKEGDEDCEIEDPRTQLVQRLIEYKQFKEASKELAQLAEESKYNFYRKLFEEDAKPIETAENIVYKNATLFDLIKALKTILQKNKINAHTHIIRLITVTIEEKIKLIMNKLTSNPRISFFVLVKENDRQHIVATFLAVLELLKSRRIRIHQSDIFSDIIISTKTESEPVEEIF